jgi:hypothetical protein
MRTMNGKGAIAAVMLVLCSYAAQKDAKNLSPPPGLERKASFSAAFLGDGWELPRWENGLFAIRRKGAHSIAVFDDDGRRKFDLNVTFPDAVAISLAAATRTPDGRIFFCGRHTRPQWENC